MQTSILDVIPFEKMCLIFGKIEGELFQSP